MPKTTAPLETLLAELHDPDSMVRSNAARQLGQTRDPRAVEALLLDLKDPDWRARRNAAQALGVARDPRAVEPLIQALQDRTMTVRCRAAVALGRLKDPRAIGPLIIALSTPGNSPVYPHALQALRKFGKAGITPLLEALPDAPPRRRYELQMILADLAHPAAIAPLIEALRDADSLLRQCAAAALGKIGDQRAVEPLIEALAAEGSDSQSTATDPQSLRAMAAAIQTQTIVVRALGQLGDARAAAPLLGLLRDHALHGLHADLYRAITEAFQRLGGLPRHFTGLVLNNLPALMGRRSGEQAEALKGRMGAMGDRLAALPDGPIKDMAAALAMAMTSEFTSMLEEAKTTASSDVETLIAWLAADAPLTRLGAAVGLPWYMDRRAVEPLRGATRDSNVGVRIAAGWALGALEKALRDRPWLWGK